jgi:uncharacterized zinc-type alcohol dehydrogenase-like protein
LNAAELELTVSHCGVCHNDVHLIDNDFGLSRYPLVPGHEVIGTISAIGREVAGSTVGQRVGVSWQHSMCMQCDSCRTGLEHLCTSSRPALLGGFGGFAQCMRVDHRFAVPIPDALDSATAAPLLCGGITLYLPMSRLVRPAARVGVIGIGGLGHLALQFARAMGAEVYAFSNSAGKRDEAHGFGAHHFVESNDPAQMQRIAGSLDVLVTTSNVNLNWGAWLATLRKNGTFLLPAGPVDLPVLPMVFGQFSFTGSVIGTPRTIAEMLRFAALHDVRAAVEVLPMDQANLALDKVRRNQARYRMVLENLETEV